MDQQQRTVRISRSERGADPPSASGQDVLVAAVGLMRRTSSGRSVRETLEGAGIQMPAAHQCLRVNDAEVRDVENTIVRAGDKVTIVNRVAGGSMMP